MESRYPSGKINPKVLEVGRFTFMEEPPQREDSAQNPTAVKNIIDFAMRVARQSMGLPVIARSLILIFVVTVLYCAMNFTLKGLSSG